jgi:uncharacterized protein YabE (DUF348 family)
MHSTSEETTYPTGAEQGLRHGVAAPHVPLIIREFPWSWFLRATAAGTLVLVVAMAMRWAASERLAVSVSVDGQVDTVASFRPSVGALLLDLGIELRPEDHLQPAAQTPLRTDMQITIQRARPFLIEADGGVRRVYSHATTVGELLSESDIVLKPGDLLWLGADVATLDTILHHERTSAEVASKPTVPSRAWEAVLPKPTRIAIRRSIPITVNDGGVPYTIYTNAPTIGEALADAEMTLYLGDRVEPALGAPVSSGQRVFISRSKSVMVNADGHRLRTRTRGETVGDALVDLGVFAVGSDRVTPSLESRLVDHMEIAVTRVRESILVEREVIPYDFIMVPDDGLEIDHQRLARQGQDGEFRTRYRLVEEDGVEVVREMTDAWVAAEPVTRVTAYGRQLISRPLETPDGAVSYWRKIRMYATSYSPARSGTPKSAPWYGRTRLGLNLRKGIVAVDTSVIPLRSRVYVPGYGIAIAGDTGGGVRGKWIDLGFEDHDYESWHRWVDVYVLDPPPAARQIRWVLPNYPPPGFPRSR